jgi:hypothetical protein
VKPQKRKPRPVPEMSAKMKRRLNRFALICTYIYGERWQSDVSRALRLNERTVRAWVQGRTNITPPVFRAIEPLLSKKIGRGPAVMAIMQRCLAESGD